MKECISEGGGIDWDGEMREWIKRGGGERKEGWHRMKHFLIIKI